MAEIDIWYCKETGDIIPFRNRPVDAESLVVAVLDRRPLRDVDIPDVVPITHYYYRRYRLALPED